MTDRKNTTTKELVCDKCGEIFVHRCKNNNFPSYCSYCYDAMRKAREEQIEAEKQQIEDERWHRQSIVDKKHFEEQLLRVSTIPIEELRPHVSSIFKKLVNTDDDDDFEEYSYINSTRKKLRDLAEMVSIVKWRVFADDNDYHNLAVDYVRLNLYDCALWILERGL